SPGQLADDRHRGAHLGEAQGLASIDPRVEDLVSGRQHDHSDSGEGVLPVGRDPGLTQERPNSPAAPAAGSRPRYASRSSGRSLTRTPRRAFPTGVFGISGPSSTSMSNAPIRSRMSAFTGTASALR